MGAKDTYNPKDPLKRLWGLIKLEKKNIYYIYFYAMINGILYLSLPLGIQAIMSFMLAQQLSASLILLIVMVILGVLANGYFYIIQMRVTERMQIRLFSMFSLAYADKLPKLQQENINDYHLPETVNRFFDIASVQKGISKILLDLPVASVQILFGLILLSFYHASFILFGLVLILMLYLAIKFTGTAGITTSFVESDYKYKVGYCIEEIARNMRTFKLRGRTELPINRTNDYLQGYLQARSKHFSILQSQFWAFIFFKTIITASMLIVGCYLFFYNKINIGQFIASEIIIIMTLSSVEKIITSIDGVYDLLTSLEKASKVLDNPIEQLNDTREEIVNKLDFEIIDLNFKYPNGVKYTLNDISLTIKQGERIAVVGTKDSGKSTLLRLLTGIYRNFEGSINVNNKPLLSHNLSAILYKIVLYFSD
jgi:ABC-type bacteriocin/lantibiotic exporter with double-glycine peptidase domain